MAKMKQNSPQKVNRLDLHGYLVEDVADAVDRFIVQMTAQGKKVVHIMPGKGSGKVKEAVVSYLKLGGFPWKFENLANGKLNEGVLVVFLD